MHDWTLLSIVFEWKTATAILLLQAPGGKTVEIIATGVLRLDIPRREEWGPSVSINSVLNPVAEADDAHGARRIAIEMQSGDVITIVAASFVMPATTPSAVDAVAAAAE